MNKTDFYALEKKSREEGIQKLVVGACVMHDGKVLVLKRCLKEEFMPGLIELPSGGVDDGEMLVDALVREVQEETNLKIVSKDRYLGSFDYTSHSGRKARQFNFLVTVEDADGVKINDLEHSEFFWVEPHSEELKKHNVSAQTLEVIGKI